MHRSNLRSAGRTAVVAALALTAPAACLPYTVGSTAQPVAPGEVQRSGSVYIIPNAIELLGDSGATSLRGADAEVRWGLTERTDLGLRVPSFSGAVVTAKHRLWGRAQPEAPALAVMGGAGVVNWAEHAHFELSLLASGAISPSVTPYGGLRVMQVAPLSSSAVRDSPTAGGFLGLRIGDGIRGISPEIGIYRDRSALGLRKTRTIYVPAITIHGDLFPHVFPPRRQTRGPGRRR
jgi:hypothetical protein